MSSINLLHVFGRMQRGGAELRTLDIMRNSDRSHFRYHFCVLSGLPGTLDDEIRDLKGYVHYCKLDLLFPFRFILLLRSQRIHVVHSHVHFFSGYLLLLAWIAGIPTRIAHFRSTNGEPSKNYLRLLQRRAGRFLGLRFATKIFAVSEGTMFAAVGVNWQSDRRCQVIYNGIDLSGFREYYDRTEVFAEFGLPEQTVLFIHVGRMAPVKNHVRLIRIFGEIVKRQPHARLLLIGRKSGCFAESVQREVKRLDLCNSVVFAGERTDVARLLQAANAMIFPSYYEGMPGAVLEACAAGTPTLASDIPAIREIAVAFPSLVKALALSEVDSTWADLALSLASESHDRREALLYFEKSAFQLSDAMKTYSSVWASIH